jgi:hypothetical protein
VNFGRCLTIEELALAGAIALTILCALKLVVRRKAASRVAQFYCEMNKYGNRFMQLGYGRVSTNEQDTAAQVSALKSAGCEKIFREKASGGRWDRPELHRLLEQLRKGDILVVWRLDRLSRSLRDVLGRVCKSCLMDNAPRWR